MGKFAIVQAKSFTFAALCKAMPVWQGAGDVNQCCICIGINI
jgi:hypothetical protein